MNYKLHYAPDNASLIIRIFLEEIEAKYTCNLIDRKQNSQKDPKYLALNPNGLIPVLETNDGPIFETAAILLWLADQHKCNFPEIENNKRAYGLKWLFFYPILFTHRCEYYSILKNILAPIATKTSSKILIAK